MNIEVELTREPIAEKIAPPPAVAHGAWLEFRGVVRDREGGRKISALEYEAYPEMAEREIRRLLADIARRHPCLAAKVIHRIGIVPVGETAIYLGAASAHRGEAISLLAEFMDRLKRDAPIWKRRAHGMERGAPEQSPSAQFNALSSKEMAAATERQPVAGGPIEAPKSGARATLAAASLEDAISKISAHCAPLPAVSIPLESCFGHVLRETVCAPADFPDCDRSTRDGFAILENDASETFQIVDTLHAADWRPRSLSAGQTVRVATGAAMPCPNLRVIMQEHVERNGETLRVLKRDADFNIRRRGEEIRAGAPMVQAGARLDAGHLALLASSGCARPRVSPRLRVVHFTTGDEVVPPGEKPKPGQIRDSNSALIRGLLQRFPCELAAGHLSENFGAASAQIKGRQPAVERADVLLISGGASVGDKDFTRALLESLNFRIVFGQAPIRPGRPTIFGVNGRRIAFGLPGNPLAHFVCFHLFIAPALALLSGGQTNGFRRGSLAGPIRDASNPRETLWPARLDYDDGGARLLPLGWSSSGDITCLTRANALLRVPPNCERLEAGAGAEFLLA
ncbi:MAG: molybdenum cofactor biosynthesis protein MoaE [Limisphaerales bacterium]